MLGVDAPAAQAPRCLYRPYAWLCEDRWGSECHLLVFNIRGLGFCFWGIRAQCVTIHARPAEQHVAAVDVGLPSVSAKVSQFFTVGKSMHTALEQPQNVTHFHTPTKRHNFSHIFTLQPPIPSSTLTASPPSQTQSKSSTVQRLERARDASHTTPLTPVCLCHSPVGMSIVIPEGCVTKLYQRGLGFCCRRQHGYTIDFFLHDVPRTIRSYAVVEDRH